MAEKWTDQKWLENSGVNLRENLAQAFGFNSGDWSIVENVKIKGKSQAIHTFELALESNRDHSVIPVLYLHELEEGKSEKIMLHRVKSSDISASNGYVIADYDMDAKERALCEICNLRIVRLSGTPVVSNGEITTNSPIKYETRFTADYSQPHSFRDRRPQIKRRNRDRTKITQEILENVLYLEGASITQLIYKCNLNYKSAKTILDEMISKELIKTVDYKNTGKRYELTERGRRALERLRIYESV